MTAVNPFTAKDHWLAAGSQRSEVCLGMGACVRVFVRFRSVIELLQRNFISSACVYGFLSTMLSLACSYGIIVNLISPF